MVIKIGVAAPLQVDRRDPEGQQRHSTCRSVEARNRTWPWSVATAQAGYALNDERRDIGRVLSEAMGATTRSGANLEFKKTRYLFFEYRTTGPIGYGPRRKVSRLSDAGESVLKK